jgi:hypothetical protein
MVTKRKANPILGQLPKQTKLPSNEVSEDLTHGQSVCDQAKEYCLATVKFRVDNLTSEWADGCNQELDKRQVSTLCEIFEGQQLQCESEKNWLSIACSWEEVKRIKAYLEQAGEPTGSTGKISSPWP